MKEAVLVAAECGGWALMAAGPDGSAALPGFGRGAGRRFSWGCDGRSSGHGQAPVGGDSAVSATCFLLQKGNGAAFGCAVPFSLASLPVYQAGLNSLPKIFSSISFKMCALKSTS
jgi:hypothetical protein